MADGACFLVVLVVRVGETCTPIFVRSPKVSFFSAFLFFITVIIIILSKPKGN